MITEFDIYIKYVQRGGNGFVSLKDQNFHPNIFCPETQSNCLPIIFDNLKLKFKDGITLHHVLNSLKIMNGYVPVTKIKKYISFLAEPVRFILHHVKDGSFPTKISACTIIKPDDCPSPSNDVHIGNIMNHYFLASKPSAFKNLCDEDFQKLSTTNEKELSNLDTTNPVKTFDWRKKRSLR